MADNDNNQPPAGYIWPSGFYPIYQDHGLNLLAAEKYVEGQRRRQQSQEWVREYNARIRAENEYRTAKQVLIAWAVRWATGLGIIALLSLLYMIFFM